MKFRKKDKGQNLVFNVIIFLSVFIAAFLFGYFFVKDFVPKKLNPDSKIAGKITEVASSEVLPSNDVKEIPRENIEIINAHPTVQNAYFENSLFIGDSLTLGLQTNSYITYDNVLAAEGFEVADSFDFNMFPKGDNQNELVPLVNAVEGRKEPNVIYIMLGINSLPKEQIPAIIDQYTKLVRTLQKNFPNSEIVVQSVLPITKTFEQQNKQFDNKKIDLLNSALLEMCASENVYFLNVASIFKTSYGYLHENFAGPDGIHLSKEGYEKWSEYIKTHLPNPPSDPSNYTIDSDAEKDSKKPKDKDGKDKDHKKGSTKN